MTRLALLHADDCPCPSTFYELRPGGWAWLACRRCNAQAVRRIPAKDTTNKENQ